MRRTLANTTSSSYSTHVKKIRIIFFPSEPGIAHITRSLAIAEVLANRGHAVYFALHKILARGHLARLELHAGN